MKLCEKCNKINVDDAKVCKYCGESLIADIPFGFKVVNDLDDDSPSLNQHKESISSNALGMKVPSSKAPITSSVTAKSSSDELAVRKEYVKKDSTISDSKKVSIEKPSIATSNKEEPVKKIANPSPQKGRTAKSTKEYVAKDAKSIVTIRPILSGKSVRYADKINSYDGFEKIKCPKCGSDNITLVSDTQKKGFSTGNACCGWFLFGPIGVLCGSMGSNKTTTTEYWVCGGCGNHFKSNSGNAAKEKIKHQGMLLSNVPDSTIDNVESLYAQSSAEVDKIRSHYKTASKDEYLNNNKLKLYAIISLAITVIAIILAVLLYFVFDAGWTATVISASVAIIVAVAALIFKPSLEKKFASEYFIQAQSDLKEAIEINKQLKNIKEAKENLSKLRII